MKESKEEETKLESGEETEETDKVMNLIQEIKRKVEGEELTSLVQQLELTYSKEQSEFDKKLEHLTRSSCDLQDRYAKLLSDFQSKFSPPITISLPIPSSQKDIAQIPQQDPDCLGVAQEDSDSDKSFLPDDDDTPESIQQKIEERKENRRKEKEHQQEDK